jgi:hypothetical protein
LSLDFDQQPYGQDDHNKKPKVIDGIHGSPRLIPTLRSLILTFYLFRPAPAAKKEGRQSAAQVREELHRPGTNGAITAKQ